MLGLNQQYQRKGRIKEGSKSYCAMRLYHKNDVTKRFIYVKMAKSPRNFWQSYPHPGATLPTYTIRISTSPNL